MTWPTGHPFRGAETRAGTRRKAKVDHQQAVPPQVEHKCVVFAPTKRHCFSFRIGTEVTPTASPLVPRKNYISSKGKKGGRAHQNQLVKHSVRPPNPPSTHRWPQHSARPTLLSKVPFLSGCMLGDGSPVDGAIDSVAADTRTWSVIF
jgi:hypothetical protein